MQGSGRTKFDHLAHEHVFVVSRMLKSTNIIIEPCLGALQKQTLVLLEKWLLGQHLPVFLSGILFIVIKHFLYVLKYRKGSQYNLVILKATLDPWNWKNTYEHSGVASGHKSFSQTN